MNLQTAFCFHFIFYLFIPLLYFFSFFYRDPDYFTFHGVIDSNLVDAMYTDLDVNSQTQRTMAFLLLSFVAHLQITLFLSLFIYRNDKSYRKAVHLNCFSFHFLQILFLFLMKQLDFSLPGTVLFYSVHGAFSLMFFLAREERDEKVKEKKK